MYEGFLFVVVPEAGKPSIAGRLSTV